MATLNWNNITVTLGELKAWAHNPRMSTKAQAKRILQSFERFGQVQPVAVGPEFEVYDGHQRLSALLTLHGKDYRIDARQSSRALTDAERRELVVSLHAGAVGSWDWDALSAWPVEQLRGEGFDDELLKQWNNDANNLKEMLGAEDDDNPYSQSVKAPIYTPKGKKPNLAQLVDTSKVTKLLEEIGLAEISDEEKVFLRLAAMRHAVIDFQNVAEYYAQSSPEMQRLMENSALVVIDFNKAIEDGYVRLSKKIQELQGEQD